MSEDRLSVAHSPQASGQGVRRLNRLPLLVIFSVLVIALAVLSWAVYQRAQVRQVAAQEKPVIQQQDMGHVVDKLMAGYQDGGLVASSVADKSPESQAVQEPEPTVPAVEAVIQPPVVPVPTPRIEPLPVKQNEPPQRSAEEQAALQRYAQIRQQAFSDALRALNAPSVVHGGFQSGGAGDSSHDSAVSDSLSELEQAKRHAQQLRNKVTIIRRQQPAYPPSVQPNATSFDSSLLAMLQNAAASESEGAVSQGQGGLFGNNSPEGEFTYSQQQRQMPRSETELRMGTLIPAVMISGINSDLPGEVLAQVTEPVRDSQTGRYVLIPQGTKLVGRYVSAIAEGQERVLVAWYRANFPDGSFLNLEAMNGVDQAGYSGFHDKVNKHTLDKFKEATLLSLISGGVQLSQTNADETSRQLAAALGQQWGKVGEEVVKRKLERAPTLEIRPGYRFHVFMTRDLVLERF